MEQRLANTWRMTLNEKRFIETALLSELRVDGRNLLDYRELTINFGLEDGSAEVHLGQTHVLGLVTSHLAQPYQDRENEGSLSIYTEFSPMADPSFETGRPGESAVELGRIIDRSLRESRAVDMESLCVLVGKYAWSVRIDLHILDNCGNLIDAANIAALAALLTFQRPDCTLGGEDGQEVIIHPPEVSEPLPLIVHHIPVAVTFAFFSNGNIVIVDPTHFEEALMEGRMTATINNNGDVCAIQKPGEVGVEHSVIMQCLKIASAKAAEITNKIESAVESYRTQRALRKIKHHREDASMDIHIPDLVTIGTKSQSRNQDVESLIRIEKMTLQESCDIQSGNLESKKPSSTQGIDERDGKLKSFSGGPSSWDPFSKGVNSEGLKVALAARGLVLDKDRSGVSYYYKLYLTFGHAGTVGTTEALKEMANGKKISHASPKKPAGKSNPLPLESHASKNISDSRGITSLKDAVKPKHMRRKAVSSSAKTLR